MADLLEEVGDPAERIIWDAQGSDLVILGVGARFAFGGDDSRGGTLSRVLRGSSRPLVVVPPTPRPGDGVLMAYGGGCESARTLQLFAMLGLADDATLDIVTVHRDHAQAQRIARAAGEFLQARAIKHRIHPVATKTPPADAILNEITRSTRRSSSWARTVIIPSAISSPPRSRGLCSSDARYPSSSAPDELRKLTTSGRRWACIGRARWCHGHRDGDAWSRPPVLALGPIVEHLSLRSVGRRCLTCPTVAT